MMPRSIVYAIVGIMVIYLLLQVGVLGVVHWQDMLDPNNVASQLGRLGGAAERPGARPPPTSSPC